ncbi:tRNA nucleotidyltransferase [Neisseria gonorrhoeae]|uniref:tRNA nucleotidyltransferase n=1 Tax=Neisseria gonorrhoeae TaxID=485 RepID=A0A378VWU9_NEIGO|nr:tRNA nucleotidyltransferase [Neisseria gonorrhoeae]
MQTYLVGGAVRDYLLGLPVKDRDWVVVGADAQPCWRKVSSRSAKIFLYSSIPKRTKNTP